MEQSTDGAENPEPGQPAAGSDSDPDAGERRTAATALTGGFVALTAALGLFGGLTGSVARMTRNHPVWTPIGIGFVLFSVVLALLTQLIHANRQMKLGKKGWLWNRFLLKVALGCFVVGAVISIVALSSAISRQDRPSVTAKLARDAKGVLTVTGAAQAGGLRADQQLFVLVTSVDGTGVQHQAYYAVAGPNQSGSVNHSFSALLEPDTVAVVVSAGRDGIGKACALPANIGALPRVQRIPKLFPRHNKSLTACAAVAVAAQPSPSSSPARSP